MQGAMKVLLPCILPPKPFFTCLLWQQLMPIISMAGIALIIIVITSAVVTLCDELALGKLATVGLSAEMFAPL